MRNPEARGGGTCRGPAPETGREGWPVGRLRVVAEEALVIDGGW